MPSRLLIKHSVIQQCWSGIVKTELYLSESHEDDEILDGMAMEIEEEQLEPELF